jgi:transposase InsO family protein
MDQQAKFTLQLVVEVYKLLRIKPIRTSSCHPQTYGLVKRFNETLKGMLKKTAMGKGRDWNRPPYVLSAYCEVPQALTGFLPFELLYRRLVQGPLDILQETWERPANGSESTVSYVLTMRDKLAKMSKPMQENLEQAQAT